ncbi:hypothetical protein [Coraliomargarita parva]|uniref:hypothetical protein n=1 Tax=Coraliomargarita parva TaxID=3014050 RepID=UPI0022B3D5AE|nr:hypothetical protein [Coraliomargarita parva]
MENVFLLACVCVLFVGCFPSSKKFDDMPMDQLLHSMLRESPGSLEFDAMRSQVVERRQGKGGIPSEVLVFATDQDLNKRIIAARVLSSMEGETAVSLSIGMLEEPDLVRHVLSGFSRKSAANPVICDALSTLRVESKATYITLLAAKCKNCDDRSKALEELSSLLDDEDYTMFWDRIRATIYRLNNKNERKRIFFN